MLNIRIEYRKIEELNVYSHESECIVKTMTFNEITLHSVRKWWELQCTYSWFWLKATRLHFLENDRSCTTGKIKCKQNHLWWSASNFDSIFAKSTRYQRWSFNSDWNGARSPRFHACLYHSVGPTYSDSF